MHIVIIGGLTIDELYRREELLAYKPGGGVYYISNILSELGIQHEVITITGEDYPDRWISEYLKTEYNRIIHFKIHGLKSIRFKNIYLDNRRLQYVDGGGYKISQEHISNVLDRPAKNSDSIIVVSPVFNEVDPYLIMNLSRYGLIIIDLQGYLRKVDNTGMVYNECRLPYELKYASLIKASYKEVCSIFKCILDNLILKYYNDVNKAVIITLDGFGSISFRGGRCIFTPAYKVSNIDPTGAGDVFIAGLTYYIMHCNDMQIKDLTNALAYANALASFKVEGVLRNIPHIELSNRISKILKSSKEYNFKDALSLLFKYCSKYI